MAYTYIFGWRVKECVFVLPRNESEQKNFGWHIYGPRIEMAEMWFVSTIFNNKLNDATNKEKSWFSLDSQLQHLIHTAHGMVIVAK